MRSDRGQNNDAITYFVLDSPRDPGGADEPGTVELARFSRRGAAFYDPVTGSWINDPLLGAEILIDSTWRPARAHELPPGVVADVPAAGASTRRRFRKRRRGGTHAA